MGNTVLSENKCPSDCSPARSGSRLPVRGRQLQLRNISRKGLKTVKCFFSLRWISADGRRVTFHVPGRRRTEGLNSSLTSLQTEQVTCGSPETALMKITAEVKGHRRVT